MTNQLELNAFLEQDGEQKPFYLRISTPLQAKGETDYFCRVHAPLLFDKDKNIYGIDEEQASLLAIDFVRSLLRDKRIIDGKGQSIDWESFGLGRES
jgi:hypothetical protein